MTATETEDWTGQHGKPRPSDVIDLGGALASAGLTYEFPLATVVALQSLAFKLVTDGNAANRQVVVKLLDGLGVVSFAIPAPAVQTATTTVEYSFAPLVPLFGTLALGFMGGPLPGGKLPYNMALNVTVAAAQAADKLSLGRLLVHQWPTRADYGPHE